MVTVPLYVPAVRLPGETLTVTELGAVPVVGVTESQLPLLPFSMVELAENVSPLVLPVTEMVCGDGVEPPAW
jgi:hypothetical protein